MRPIHLIHFGMYVYIRMCILYIHICTDLQDPGNVAAVSWLQYVHIAAKKEYVQYVNIVHMQGYMCLISYTYIYVYIYIHTYNIRGSWAHCCNIIILCEYVFYISYTSKYIHTFLLTRSGELLAYFCDVHVWCADVCYGMASISRLLKIIGLCCKRALQKRWVYAKETYNFKEPTNRSNPIYISCTYTYTYTHTYIHTGCRECGHIAAIYTYNVHM